MAFSREHWISRSIAYYRDVLKMVTWYLPEGGDVLEVGCSTGWLLRNLPSGGARVGVDIDPAAIAEAQRLGGAEFRVSNFEKDDLVSRFDLIVVSDVLPFAYDVQALLENARRHLKPGGRVFVSSYNSYLKPLYRWAEGVGLKRKSQAENWLTVDDVLNLSDLAGFEAIRQGFRAMVPWSLGGLGSLLNRWLAPLPCFRFTNLYYYTLLRPLDQVPEARAISKVTVVIPARNEAGNIHAAIERMPRLASRVEVVFVEGNSTDDTWGVIQETLQRPRPEWMDIQILKQPGKGKADAVHVGFAAATGDVLMILDADLTVPPEDLPRFLKPLQEGRADFVHGSRLVYPMEGEAMRFLNMLGNKFFSICFSFLLGQRFKDTLCGTKVFFRRDWKRILQLRTFFGDFDPFGDFEMIFGAVKLNHKVAEIPIHYKARVYGETNIHRFRHGLILLRMVFFAAPKMKFI
jgi:SAM-dependent methyltransferase